MVDKSQGPDDVDVSVDLDNCAQEPIHIPGSIQPRGFLFTVNEFDLTVSQVSANAAEIVSDDAVNILGRPLSEVLGQAAASTIARATAAFGDLGDRNPLELVLHVGGAQVQFDAILHRMPDSVLLVELEPAEGPRPFSFPNTYLAVRGAVADLNRAAELTDLYEIAAKAVQHLTGFDRVMVYRYDHDFNGEVVAEVKRDDLEPFLGLHYPASDIPSQARALYEKNWIRLISDVGYRAVPIIPTLDPATAQPLDLSLSTLRSVSPIHIEYLQNMGVRASMSISLLRHGKLWGLIACHHYAGPHAPPYGARAAAEFLGSTLSLRLVDRAEEMELRGRLESQEILVKLSAAIRNASDPLTAAMFGSPGMADLIPADGLAIFTEGRHEVRGTVPDPATVEAIAAWVASTGEDLIATDSLSAIAPDLGLDPPSACGVLAVALPRGQYLMWFRDEAVQAVDWSGDPRTKASPQQDASVRLSPRKSFDRWREIVRFKSQPWTERQTELALELRSHSVEALYSRSQRELRLAADLQRSLLPTTLPSLAGWDISAHYQPAEGGQIGGDWYDAFVLADGKLGLALGDVAGHGIGAAGTMAQLRNALRGYLLDTGSPAQTLNRLNHFTTMLLPDAFATVVVACMDPSTGQVTACSAGHLPPYLVGIGEAGPAPVKNAPPLGVGGTSFSVDEFTLAPGASMVLYSDGLIERRNEGIDHSIDRLATTLRRLGPRPSADEIFTAAAQPHAFDDATILTIHRHPATQLDNPSHQ